ncbi:MAG: hypothetical protein LLG02_06470 [Pelosinus sp.]|nr:hypothetical protein [Pelosinus sp.]
MADPLAIIDTIMADINAIMPNFSTLVSSYRLLVGATEEIQRQKVIPEDIYWRAVQRFDNAGTLIDIMLELLCCKISFSAEFLTVTCAPVDIFRLLVNPEEATDTPFRTAEEILQLEALRRLVAKTRENTSAFKCAHSAKPTPTKPPEEQVPPASRQAPEE